MTAGPLRPPPRPPAARASARARRGAPAGAAGFVTTQFVAAAALTLVLLVQLGNVLVVAYARGVVRAALDDGVRGGAAVAPSAVTVCQDRAADVLAELLAGALGKGVTPVTCTDDGVMVRATASATFPSWLPGVPDWPLQASAVASRRLPEDP